MGVKTKGFAVQANGFFMTKKGEFMPLGDTTAIFDFKNDADKAGEVRLGNLLPGTYQMDSVKVRRVWVTE